MAKSASKASAKALSKSSPFHKKLQAIEDLIAEQEEMLAQAQDQLRLSPMNADLRAHVQRLKEPLMQWSIERGFYLRAISEAAGGKSHMPPA